MLYFALFLSGSLARAFGRLAGAVATDVEPPAVGSRRLSSLAAISNAPYHSAHPLDAHPLLAELTQHRLPEPRLVTPTVLDPGRAGTKELAALAPATLLAVDYVPIQNCRVFRSAWPSRQPLLQLAPLATLPAPIELWAARNLLGANRRSPLFPFGLHAISSNDCGLREPVHNIT